MPLGHRGSASAYRRAAGLVAQRQGSPYRNASQLSRGGGAQIGAHVEPDAPVDQSQLDAALAKCHGDKQQRLVRSIAALTAGKKDYWPVADVIAHHAGIKLDNNVYRSLARLVERRAIRDRAPKNGYRLAGS
ncbi:MAG: hypothetical protein ACREHD_03615 [Pirellulales bacterium]